MEIMVLGAHNIESKDTGCVSLLIDGVLAVDAGALTSSLSFADQMKLQAVLLSHPHYDHMRDIPALGMNLALHRQTIDLYAIEPVFDALASHFINDMEYPDYFRRPSGEPVFRRHALEPGGTVEAAGYTVRTIEMVHSVPAAGFLITAPDGKSVCFTGDTGPGPAERWQDMKPDVLIIETTALNSYEDFARKAGHLTPALLREELKLFRGINGYLPRVVTVHMNPLDEPGIRAELDTEGDILGIKIETSYEGMRITV